MKKYFIKKTNEEVKAGDIIEIDHGGYAHVVMKVDQEDLDNFIEDNFLIVKDVPCKKCCSKSGVSKDTQKDIDDFFNLLDTHIAAPEKSTKPTKPTESKAIMHKIKAIHNHIDALEYGLHEARKTLDELKDMLKSKQ